VLAHQLADDCGPARRRDCVNHARRRCHRPSASELRPVPRALGSSLPMISLCATASAMWSACGGAACGGRDARCS
jgi:hypothetical protein